MSGTLYIDNVPLVFAPIGGGDVRYHAVTHLTQGLHDLVAYHCNFAQQGYISIGWKKTTMPRVEVIHREAFGVCFSGLAGPLEMHNKTLIADFGINQMAECYFADGYGFHYRFTPKVSLAQASDIQWDFGDGQTSTKAEVDHVYLTDGIYTVKMKATVDGNKDTQSCQLAVSRNYAHILDAREDQPSIQSGIVQEYNTDAIPAESLPRVIQLYVTAEQPEAAVPLAEKLAAMKHHSETSAVMAALSVLERKLIAADKPELAIKIWDRVPPDADIQPSASRHAAELALWWTGDFAKAVKLLKPYSNRADPGLHRRYGEALLLAGQGDEGRKILENEPSQISREPQGRSQRCSCPIGGIFHHHRGC